MAELRIKYLTPSEKEGDEKDTLTINTNGKSLIILKGALSMNLIEFKDPNILCLELQWSLNGSTHYQTINLNSWTDEHESALKASYFPKRYISFDSYFKVKVFDKSKEKVDFKIEVPHNWSSQ